MSVHKKLPVLIKGDGEMKNIKGIISLVICIALALSMTLTSQAATIASLVAAVGTDVDRTVQVTVNYNSPEEAQESTLLVVKKGVSIVTAKQEEIHYIDQKKVDGNSVTYYLKLAQNDRIGQYDLYVGGTKVDAPAKTEINFDMDSTTTIKFIKEDGVEIASPIMVSSEIGATINLGSYVPETITYQTSIYAKDTSNPSTFVAESSTNYLTITYTYLSEKREQIRHNGVSYDIVTDNLIYNGDMSELLSDGSYTQVASWQGGYVNGSHKPLSDRPYLSEGGGWRSTTNHHFIINAATDTEMAYVTTPALSTMENNEQYPFKSDANEAYMASVLTSWMMDSEDSGSYLKAESGKVYYMSFEMKATSTANVDNVVGFTAVSANGDSYKNKIPGTNGDITTLTSVLDKGIGRGRYITTANNWVTVDTVATAKSDGYFMFQLGWAHEWGQVSLRNFEIYEIEPSATNKEITVTYTINGQKVEESTETIDTSSVTRATFEEYYYRKNGTNTLYYAPEQRISEDSVVEMTLLENQGNYKEGDTISTDTAVYRVVSGNIVPNGDFAHGMNGWYSRANTTPPETYSVTTTDKPTGTARAALSTGAGGATSTNSIRQAWDIEKGETYYYSLWVKAGDEWHGLGQSASPTTESQDLVANGGFGTSGSWSQKSGIFTATNEYLVFFEGWGSVGVAEVEVYKIEEDASQAATTTVKFVASDDKKELQASVEIAGIIGSVIDLTDISLVPETIIYNGEIYSKDATNAASYTVKSSADVVEVTYSRDSVKTIEPASAVVIGDNLPVLPMVLNAKTGAGMDTTVKVKEWDLSGLKTGTNTIYGIAEDTEVKPTATVTVLESTFELENAESTTNGAGNVLNFPVSLKNEFYVEFDFKSTNIKNNWIYISKDGALWGAGQIGIGTNNDDTGALKAQPNDVELTKLSTGTVYRMLVRGDASKDTYDLTVYNTETSEEIVSVTGRGFRTASDAINSINLCTNGGGAYTLSNIKVNASKSDVETYTVKVVCGNAELDEFTAITTPDSKKGYNNQVVYPDTRVPHYEGYVFKNKTVSGSTVTLNYEEATEGNFFDNVANDTKFVSLNMLGAHDAFTAGISTSSAKYDAAGILQGDSGSKAAVPGLFGSATTSVNASRAQTQDALELLNSGVRYFDIRLSRSDKTARAGFLNMTTIQHTNSVFYTTHGMLSDEFKPIAYTIAQWATEHPGEIIVLDFQEMWDATSSTGTNGDSVAQSWRDLNAILEETGINAFVKLDNNSDLSQVTYGNLTENGTKAGIVLFGRAVATNDNIGKFILRGTTSTAFDGKMYSNYDKGGASVSSSALNLTYINAQVNHAYTESGTVTNMYRVMQAISSSANLINKAGADNTFIANAVKTNPTYLTTLPVIMVNDATVNTGDLLTTLKSCNEPVDVTLNFSIGGEVVDSGTTKMMVGTLFTGGVTGAVYSGANGDYTVIESLTGEIPVPYNGSITLNVEKKLTGYNVTIDGKTTVEYEQFTLPASGVAYFNVGTNEIYKPAETITLTGDIVLISFNSLGLNMVDGAQVRIGSGVDNEGKIDAESGLRFITIVEHTDTIAALMGTVEMEMGVEVTAEKSSDPPVVIKAQKWQVEDTVFTSAITDLAETNYNRRFTATPYIKIGEKVFYGESVTRSVYQVAAGLLMRGDVDDSYEDENNEMTEILVKVLNAYVNQTGVRLTLSDATESAQLTARTEEGRIGAYTGDAFFTVGETSYSEGKYTVTLTAAGKAKIDVNLFNEYVRINNNNSLVSAHTTITDNGDGTYTLVFDYANVKE